MSWFGRRAPVALLRPQMGDAKAARMAWAWSAGSTITNRLCLLTLGLFGSDTSLPEVIPAQAGIHSARAVNPMDPRLRGDDMSGTGLSEAQ